MAEYSSFRILAGRIRMHVLDWPGEEPPILFLHGITANSLAAVPFANLIDHRLRVVAPDLRGRGVSDAPVSDYGPNMHIRDIAACIERLEIGQYFVGGHSFGANLSIFLAAKYPDRVKGLILYEGGALPSGLAAQFLSEYYQNLQYRYATQDEYVDRYRGAPLYQPFTPELEALVRSNLYQQPDGTYIRRVPRYVIEAERLSQQQEIWKSLPSLYPKVKCPVLIIRAGNGLFGPEDQVLNDEVLDPILAGIPQAQVITVPEAGHTSIMTIPSTMRDNVILEFLGINS